MYHSPELPPASTVTGRFSCVVATTRRYSCVVAAGRRSCVVAAAVRPVCARECECVVCVCRESSNASHGLKGGAGGGFCGGLAAATRKNCCECFLGGQKKYRKQSTLTGLAAPSPEESISGYSIYATTSVWDACTDVHNSNVRQPGRLGGWDTTSGTHNSQCCGTRVDEHA